jgi:hypothetical protein
VVAVLAWAVTTGFWAIVYSTYFPYRSVYSTFSVLLRCVRGTYKNQDAHEEEQPSEDAHAGYDSEADGDQKT